MANCPRCGTAYLSETSHVCRGIFAAFHQDKPMRDTATLLELLEAERAWLRAQLDAAMQLPQSPENTMRQYNICDAGDCVDELLHFYREEASREA